MDKYLLILNGSSTDEFYELSHYPKEGEYAESKPTGKRAGGPPLNMGCVCASKGGNVKSLDYLETDSESSKLIVETLNKYNIDTSYIEYGDAINCKVVIMNSNSHRTMFVTHPKRPHYVIDDKKQGLLNNASYIYSMMHIINRSFENLDSLIKAKQNGAKILLDGSSEYTEVWEKEILFTLADGLFINDEDYEHLRMSKNEDPKEKLFNNGCEFICVTNGEKGATCYTKEKTYKADSILTNVIDSTGAGDSFAGGFVYGLLQGYDYKKCLKIASACGSYACNGLGGQAAAVSIDEIQEYAKKNNYSLD